MMDRGKRMEALQDELLLRTAADILMEEAAEEFHPFKSDNTPYHRQQLDQSLGKITVTHRRKRLWANRGKAAKRLALRVAVVFLVAFSAMSALFLTVEAFRVKILNLFTREEAVYMDFGAIPDSDSLRAAGFLLAPSQLPEGYGMVGVDSGGAIRRILYANAKGDNLFFEQHGSGQMFSLDTEQYREEVQVHGSTGYLIQLDGFTSIIWEQEGCFCVITGYVDRSTALQMAESVQRLQ